MMLMRNLKASEESVVNQYIDVHNLIPCGDVNGLLAVSVKQCKDFTPKFDVKHDTYLLIRISIDKIMKCTNPQVFRPRKKHIPLNFGDVRYFSLKVPKQRSDPRNRITLELVGFDGPKDFPRLYGNANMHLYEVIQKQSFIETCAMRIRNMVFCTAEVEYMFCYGCLGYGYSHQLKLPGADPAKSVAYSMFLRVPPPEDRRDNISNAIKPLRMDYPAFLSPDLNVSVAKIHLDKPKPSEHYKSLQDALHQPPRERLEKLKTEYRNLKTWHEKADYLDQLILKKGPKVKPGQAKVSRFKEAVGKIQRPQASTVYTSSASEVMSRENVRSFAGEDMKKWTSQISTLSSRPSGPVPSRRNIFSAEQIPQPAETTPPVPALTVTPNPTCSPVSSDGENMKDMVVTEQLHPDSSDGENMKDLVERLHPASESSLSTSETRDSESLASAGPERKATVEQIPVIVKKPPFKEYLPVPIQESQPKSEVSVSVSPQFVAPPRPSDSVVEPVQQLPWKSMFQEAVFCGHKFEPFLRSVSKVQPPPLIFGKGDVGLLEKTYPYDANKEREDQDPPDGMSLTNLGSSPDTKLIKSSGDLSILRLIERKMDLEEKDQKRGMQDEKASEPLAVTSGSSQKTLEDKLAEQAEIKQVEISFEKSLEDVLADKLVKVVAVSSILSKNLENIVAEGLSEAKLPETLEDSSLPGDNKCLPEERKMSGEKVAEPDVTKLTAAVSQNLQAHLIEKLCEEGIITDTDLPEKDQIVSFPITGDLLKRKKSSSKESMSQTEIATLKSLSDHLSRTSIKAESMQHSKESSKESIKESSKESELVVTGTGLSESKIDGDKEAASCPKIDSSSVEQTNAKTDLRKEPSKQSLEIIRVMLPVNTDTDNIKQRLSIHDALLEKILKAEVRSLKSLLSKEHQDHFKDKLSAAGLKGEDLKTVCRKLSLAVKGDGSVTPEKAALQEWQDSSSEGLAKETLAVNESIENLFEVLSENEIANLKYALNKKIQDHLSERLSKIGMITESELRRILGNLFPVVEKLAKSDEGSDEQSMQLDTQSLHDRFSEEELQNLKSLLSRLLNEGHRDKLSESEVQGLTSVLEKSFEDLPVQNSSETGISQEVEVKDECHTISLPDVEESQKVSKTDASERGEVPSKESLHKISTAGEKYKIERETVDLSVTNLLDVESRSQETQTMVHPKKVKHKKECHRLPKHSDNLTIPNITRTTFDVGLKSKSPEETLKRISEPFATSSFLSARDIGIQSEAKSYFCNKPPSFISKPPFPVNPQTFLFLHSESEEDTKPAVKHHQKAKRKKSDTKKDSGSHQVQQSSISTQTRRERVPTGSTSKEILKEKCRRHPPTSPKLSATETRKDSKATASPSGTRRETLKQKSEKKRDTEVKPKKSLTKTAVLSDPHLQNHSKNISEKSSTTKIPAPGRTKGSNTLNVAGPDDIDMEAYRHLEKAVERALLDLGRVPEGSSSQGRPTPAPSSTTLLTKDSPRSYLSAVETPRNQAGSITEMLNNQEQILKMTPEQLEVVLRIIQNILRQNARPPNNG
ncbi:C2 calcium-dependent domain-containing protein 6 [Lacerta agilis]|uniref:C2 calcium-dependent domain-containing protein 6 n=1 Tax=Lacerta agilis TaxID=80427 RepID=UPI0014199BC5|nr:C2 calcium-dependent domain-containing protein 6 [Lacerta agilis]